MHILAPKYEWNTHLNYLHLSITPMLCSLLSGPPVPVDEDAFATFNKCF